MSYSVLNAGDHAWEERPSVGGGEPRQSADITTGAELTESRARIWRLPPHTRGPRHIEGAQEEVFVVLAGTLTMLLGDPPERVDLEPQSVVSVRRGTGIQLRNQGDDEAVVFAYGAPAVAGQAVHLDDVEL
ncbi:MAG TPA: cupin domain-containing protein [Gaiellaceae bacterium]|nr:cupin domain-containing protein [Gaiellaceae bacterium]